MLQACSGSSIDRIENRIVTIRCYALIIQCTEHVIYAPYSVFRTPYSTYDWILYDWISYDWISYDWISYDWISYDWISYNIWLNIQHMISVLRTPYSTYDWCHRLLTVADVCLSSYAGVRLNHISRYISPSEIKTYSSKQMYGARFVGRSWMLKRNDKYHSIAGDVRIPKNVFLSKSVDGLFQKLHFCVRHDIFFSLAIWLSHLFTRRQAFSSPTG